ncbi:hypothetical protein PI95_016355 [Hassallia byssoidea VB512170]|uniref:Uncharacterized protein n=1 Tax=Hassallia byssoidea VB512170 TaxID=1304833 RepID=A0A846H9Q9_9CYAN|nr:hypothetical protein [Hassalia byssoidea]NEU74086.1 hypothetical protein [Hassalia byssoidea VB512170]
MRDCRQSRRQVLQAGKPLRQSLMGVTNMTALPYQRTASPTHWLRNALASLRFVIQSCLTNKRSHQAKNEPESRFHQ